MAERVEILPCNCKHEFQDETYGKGNRVHNVNTKGQAACTVCTPSYRRNKHSSKTDANRMFGHGDIPARPPRNLKNVPV